MKPRLPRSAPFPAAKPAQSRGLKPPTPDSFLMDSDTPQSQQAFALVTDYEWAMH